MSQITVSVTLPAGEDKADGSITLIKGPTNVLVDTGGPCDRETLLKGEQVGGHKITQKQEYTHEIQSQFLPECHVALVTL